MPTDRHHYQLTLADAIEAHERALRCGGRQGIINLGSIESAIHRPHSGYYRDLPRKAAALAESMVKNHGFADGNKRTTVILVNLLLERSGCRLAPSSNSASLQQEIEDMVLDVAKGDLSFDALVAWFSERTTPM